MRVGGKGTWPYKEEDRGKIVNRRRAQQILDLSGLVCDTNSPMDFDAFQEFNGSIFVIYEIKHGDADITEGERIGLERAVWGWEQGGRKAICLVGRSDIPVEQDVPVAGLPLVQYYWKGAWRKPLRPMTILEARNRFRRWASLEISVARRANR